MNTADTFSSAGDIQSSEKLHSRSGESGMTSCGDSLLLPGIIKLTTHITLMDMAQ